MIKPLFLLFALLQPFSCYNFTTKYIQVPVDHFSFTNNATFKLKYLVNDESWVPDSPVFLYTGNEGTIENFAQNTGFMFEIAPQFSALLVFVEHRYYGASLPFGNLSYSSPGHLGYLTSTQALADFVFVIDALQKGYGNGDRLPVVAFGGSYGGMLAAWLRMKYPAAVVGTIAASAPIWQFQDITPCGDFNMIVTAVYKYTLEEDCTKPIEKLWKTVRKITADDAGKAWLSSEWQLCEPLKTPSDINTLINWLTEIIVNMAMVNYPYPNSFLAPLPANPVQHFCEKLLPTADLVDKPFLSAYNNALQTYTNYTKTTPCNNIGQTAADLGESGWDFQSCTEIVMPMCATDADMFEDAPWDYAAFAAACLQTWGVGPPRPDLAVLEYAGKDLASFSNIVFSNGLLDPWSGGGVLTNVSSSVVAIVIPEGAHHLDLRAGNPLDPESVLEARKFHVENIRSWVGDFYKKRVESALEKQVYEKVVLIKNNLL